MQNVISLHSRLRVDLGAFNCHYSLSTHEGGLRGSESHRLACSSAALKESLGEDTNGMDHSAFVIIY